MLYTGATPVFVDVDPESYNIIPPEGVTNPYATGSAGDTGGDWDDGGDDAGGDWGDGDWGGK